MYPFKIKDQNTNHISENALKFIKCFPFHDDHAYVVDDDKRVTSDGNELDAPRTVVTDGKCLDTLSEEVPSHGNTSNDLTDESGMPESDSLASGKFISETMPVRKSCRKVNPPVKLKDYEVTLNCSSVKYPLSCWSLTCHKDVIREHQSVRVALNSPAWKQAMDLEM